MYLGVFILLLLSVTEVLSDSCARNCMAEMAVQAIRQLQWKRVAVIQDKENDYIVQNVHEVELLIYEIENAIEKTVLHEIHRKLFPDVNVMVALRSTGLLTHVLTEAEVFDASFNQSTDFSHHSKWVVFTNQTSCKEIRSLRLKNLQHVALASYKSANCACSSHWYTLKSTARSFRFLPLNKTVHHSTNIFPNTRYRYNQRYLRVSTVESDPFSTAYNTSKDDVPYTGYCVEVLRVIASHLNLTLQYVEARGGVWGWIDDGMMGQLKRREIDLVAGDITVHTARAQYVDYIMPIIYEDELILFYKMKPSTNSIFLLAGPFQTSVYLVYLGVGSAVMLVYIFVQTFGKFTSALQQRRACYLGWDVVKSSLKQDFAVDHLTLPGRLLLAFWCILVTVISSVYSGYLTATLATNSPLMKFRSIDEVVDSDYSAGFMPGSIVEQLLKNSSRKDVKRLYKKIRHLNITDPGVTDRSLEHQIQRVLSGSHVFVTYMSSVERVLRNDCNVSMLDFADIPHEPLAFAVQKHSPFKEDIDNVMYQLRSKGILGRMWKKWTNQTRTKLCKTDRKSVTLTELIGGTAVAGAGVAVASIFLAMECFVARLNNKQGP